MPSNSWQAYLCAMNETDTAKKNFNTFIDAMAIENSKIEKINAITEDPDSIKLVVKQKKIKFIHSCKIFGGICTNQTMTVLGLSAREQEPSLLLLSLTWQKQQLQRKQQSPWTQGFGRAKMPPN